MMQLAAWRTRRRVLVRRYAEEPRLTTSGAESEGDLSVSEQLSDGNIVLGGEGLYPDRETLAPESWRSNTRRPSASVTSVLME